MSGFEVHIAVILAFAAGMAVGLIRDWIWATAIAFSAALICGLLVSL